MWSYWGNTCGNLNIIITCISQTKRLHKKKYLTEKELNSSAIKIPFFTSWYIRKFVNMIFHLISFFSGFLTSSIIDTSLGEFSEWAIVGAALVVANIESFNNFYYSVISKNRNALINKAYLFVLFDIY